MDLGAASPTAAPGIGRLATCLVIGRLLATCLATCLVIGRLLATCL